MTVRQQDEMNFLGQRKSLRVFGIVLDKGIDKDVGAFGGLNKYRGVSEPRDARAFQ